MQIPMLPRTLVLLSALSVAAGSGCGREKAATDDKDAARPPAAAQEKLEITQAYRTGEYRMDLVQSVDQTIRVAEQPPHDQKTVQKFTISLTVSEADEEGRRQAVMTYDRIRQTMTGSGGKLNYDSDTPPGPDATPQEQALAQVMGALLDAEIRMTLSPEGEPLEVRGLDRMWDAMAAKNPVVHRVAGNMKKQLGNEAIKKMWTMQTLLLPGEPVGEGAIWNVEESMDMPVIGPADLNYTCTLQTVDREAAPPIAVVGFEGTLKAAGNRPGPVPNTELGAVSFDQEGDYSFDLALQMITRQELRQTGTLTMSEQGQTITIDQTMDQSILIRAASRE